MQTKVLLLGLALTMGATLMGCGGTSTTVNDTHTIHNREATRIWVVRRHSTSETTTDEVVYCDVAMVQAGRDLCVTWGR